MSEESTVLAPTQQIRVPADVLSVLKAIGSSLTSKTSGIAKELELSLPEIMDRVLGSDHPQQTKVLHWLAVVYHTRNDFKTAEFLYRRALEVATRMFGEFNSETGLIMNNLGRVLHDQQQFDEAESLYRRSHAVLKQTLGSDHPRLTKPLINAATLYWEQGKRIEAERLFNRSIAMLEEALGLEHPKVLKTVSKIKALKDRSLSAVPA